MPKIAVVIPAKNAANTFSETLTSLASQTFKDFEAVIIDDGSTDQTSEIAESFADAIKIKIIHHRESQGVARSINSGIINSDSEFIARLDADDVADPARLFKQLEFLEAEKRIGICGSDMRVFSESGDVNYILAHPQNNSSIKTALIQRCALSHPSLLIRRTVFDITGFYDEKFDFAEDYDLWCRASLLGIQFANINQPLTNYRIHSNQVSKQKSQIQNQRDHVVKNKYISAYLNGEDPGDLPQFFSLTSQYENSASAFNSFVKNGSNIIKLAKTIPDTNEYHQIVFGSLIRHLNR